MLEDLQERFLDLAARYDEPLTLIGHSLGGIFAREIAREYPDKVRHVISLGSPFGEGRMSGSIPARLFSALNPPEELPVEQETLADPPPVPTTAIYSRGDGIVNWRTTLQEAGHDRTQSIRVRGSHCGMTFNPAIWYLVAECLAQRSCHSAFELSWQRGGQGELAPSGARRMGANPHANGGILLRDLRLPDFRDYADCQQRVESAFRDQDRWTKMSTRAAFRIDILVHLSNRPFVIKTGGPRCRF